MLKKTSLLSYLLFTKLILAESIYNLNYNNLTNNDSVIITGQNLLEDETLFFSPINFTTNGLTCFFNHRFNHPKYVEDYLPNNLNDIIKFLEYAKESNQNRSFIKSIAKIFTKKVQETEYISSNEIISFANRLPELFDVYLIPEAKKENDEYIVKNILCTEFADNFEDFKNDPDKFLSKTAQTICSTLAQKEETQQNDITSFELKEKIIRFLENILNKSLFDVTNENTDVWEQYKQLSQSIFNLQVLLHDMDDVNDLINCIIARLKYLIIMIGAEISLETYKKAITEIHDEKIDWLEIEEHDSLIKPKKDELLYIIQNIGLPKAVARSQFGFTDTE